MATYWEILSKTFYRRDIDADPPPSRSKNAFLGARKRAQAARELPRLRRVQSPVLQREAGLLAMQTKGDNMRVSCHQASGTEAARESLEGETGANEYTAGLARARPADDVRTPGNALLACGGCVSWLF